MRLRHEWNLDCLENTDAIEQACLIQTMTSEAFENAMRQRFISKHNSPVLLLLDSPVQQQWLCIAHDDSRAFSCKQACML